MSSQSDGHVHFGPAPAVYRRPCADGQPCGCNDHPRLQTCLQDGACFPESLTPTDDRSGGRRIASTTPSLQPRSLFFRFLQRVYRDLGGLQGASEPTSRCLCTDSNPETGNEGLRGLALPPSTQERHDLASRGNVSRRPLLMILLRTSRHRAPFPLSFSFSVFTRPA